MTYVVLKKTFHLIDVSPPHALIYFLGNRILLKGEFVDSHLVDVCEFLKTPQELVDFKTRLGSFWSSSQIEQLVQSLQQYRLAEFYEDTPISDVTRYATHPVNRLFAKILNQTESLAKAIENIENTRLTILNWGLGGPELLRNLQNLGFKKIDYVERPLARDFVAQLPASSSPQEFFITITPHYQTRALRELNKILHNRKTPWLVITEDAFGGTVGPTLIANTTPCYECLIERLFSHVKNADRAGVLESYFSTKELPLTETSSVLSQQLMAIAALEIVKLSSDVMYSKTYRGHFEFDLVNYRSDFHHLLPVPNCTVCQNPQPRREFRSAPMRGPDVTR